MKIWITRRSAFQLQCGGVDRLDVWFTKPHFFYRMMQDEIDNPFGSFIQHGCREEGWRVSHVANQNSISFAAFASRDNYKENEPLIDAIWKLLEAHFNGAAFQKWDIEEKEGRAHYKDFLIEVEFKLSGATVTLTKGIQDIKTNDK